MDRNNFEPYMKVFLEENSKINLISKNEEKYLYEKHITDSLAISTFFDKYIVPETLLDIGTGGGFPAVPVAVAYPDIQVWALDSIAKKIRAIENIKQKLDLENLYPVCSRIENFKEKTFDVVTSRALASLDKLFLYCYTHIMEYIMENEMMNEFDIKVDKINRLREQGEIAYK